MSFEPSPLQVLALLRLLLVYENPPKQSELKPTLNPSQKKELSDAGLIRLESRGRAKHIVLTDKAWAWVNENPDAKFSHTVNAAPVLQTLLSKLGIYMKKNNVSLSEILSPSEIKESLDLEKEIRAAYLKASGGKWNVRVRLSDLRRFLPDISRKETDDVLCKMQIKQKLVLYRMLDPLEIRPEDERAAIDIAGHKNHIIYIEG